MLIVGSDLEELIKEFSIVENPEQNFDETSISLRLDYKIIQISPINLDPITYGMEIPKEWQIEKTIDSKTGIILEPHETLLGCSYEIVTIPIGYFGLLQTKGSLARLFVSVHSCASQIEPGFKGKITYEICNFSNLRIKLQPLDIIASLYIFKASMKSKPYNGRYNLGDEPIIQLPIKEK